MGGQNLTDSDDGVTTFQIYDILYNKFYVGSSLNRKRKYLACNVSPNGDALYVFGGLDVNNGLPVIRTSIEKLDISELTINSPETLTLSSTWSVTSMTMNANQIYGR